MSKTWYPQSDRKKIERKKIMCCCISNFFITYKENKNIDYYTYVYNYIMLHKLNSIQYEKREFNVSET